MSGSPLGVDEQRREVASTLGYRPHLDGLRAVAVYLVVLFHADIAALSGGFIGVDVFFVLSGYLVTHVMLGDLADGGGIRFARFYARRARRLLPAAVVTLTATVIVWSMLVTPAELRPVLDSVRSAFLYVANWHFIAETSGYFAADVDENPVLHFWSLSIEEQFYVLWPMLLATIFVLARRVTPRPQRAARAVVIALGAASALWAWHLSSINESRAYYGTDARAYQLLAGAAIALSPGLVGRLVQRPLMARAPGVLLPALLVAATPAIDVGAVGRGFIATAVTVLLLVALEAGRGGSASSALLASRPAVALGQVSYGTYLWHWPVVVVARMETTWRPTTLAVVSAVGGTCLAVISARCLELPIRRSTWLNGRHRAVVATGLATSAIAALAVVPLLSRSTERPVVVSAPSGEEVRLDWEGAFEDSAPRVPCPQAELDECHLQDGSGPRVLVIGDSQTWSFTPLLTEMAESEGWDLWAIMRGGCNWERDLIRESPLPKSEQEERCLAVADRWYDEIVPTIEPDVVILVRSEGESTMLRSRVRTASGPWLTWDTDEYWQAIESAATETVAGLTDEGAHVVIVEPWPITSFFATDPTECLSGATTAADIDRCAYPRGPEEPSRLETIYRAIAVAEPGVDTLDLDPAICPDGPLCPAVIDDVIVRRDWSHLTASFVRTQRNLILELLQTSGALGTDPP